MTRTSIDSPQPALGLQRRDFAKLSMGVLAAAAFGRPGQATAAEPGNFIAGLRNRPLTIGMLLFERMDQIDFTGPFAVLARVPDARIQVLGLSQSPVRDHKGLMLTPEVAIADTAPPDVLVVPGGPGQQALMDHTVLLDYIARQDKQGRALFSVCTGALLCGAAGVLRGRRATTHWSAHALLPYFGAVAVDERVVVDRDLVTAAGVTAGIDGALQLAAMLRGTEVAQQIQLDIQYAPQPPFNAGSPETAPRAVFDAVNARVQPLTAERAATARRWAERQRSL